MTLDKRDREEIERLVERQMEFEEGMVVLYQNAMGEGKLHVDDPDIKKGLDEQWGRMEYYQSLLERVRAENAPPGRAFGPRT